MISIDKFSKYAVKVSLKTLGGREESSTKKAVIKYEDGGEAVISFQDEKITGCPADL